MIVHELEPKKQVFGYGGSGVYFLEKNDQNGGGLIKINFDYFQIQK